MSLDLYEKAKKSGDKAYKEAVSKGQYPYLPVLDHIINRDSIQAETNLGLINVPLDRVVGTSTEGRTQAFASNFMPLMSAKTEFGAKWSALCDSHLAEGIHDPIKVIEYLNYYYVVEGNKRVSVLKFFGADSIPAFVTRKIPKLTDDLEIKIYYEFMDFYQKTGVNYIWFSHEGDFKRLMDLVGEDKSQKGKTEVLVVGTASDLGQGSGEAIRAEVAKAWTDDKRLDFRSSYSRFEKAYKKFGGDKLKRITTGDAYLALLELRGFEEVSKMAPEEMTDVVESMWKEFVVVNEKYEVEVSLDAPKEEKKGLLAQIFTTSYSESHPLRIAFLYDREPVLSDWLYAHELGRNHIKEVFGNTVSTLKVTTAGSEEDAIASMEDLIENEGTEVIFTTTSRLVDASLKIAIKYPNVKVLNCSINTSHSYIRTYYTRSYEAKFLSGIIAGAMTESNKVAYMADYPIFGVTASINAFALGVKMVNADAKVYLRWTDLKDGGKREDIYKALYEDGVDYISDQDMITPQKASRRFGTYKLTDGDPVNLAMPVSDWGVFYEKIINIILNGAWTDTQASNESKAMSYWWGFSSGVIDLILSDKVPAQTKRLVLALRDMIAYNKMSPFEGEIKSQDGSIRNKDGNRLEPEYIIKMDWLVDNVDGIIPKLDEMRSGARQIVEMKGVLHEDSSNR